MGRNRLAHPRLEVAGAVPGLRRRLVRGALLHRGPGALPGGGAPQGGGGGSWTGPRWRRTPRSRPTGASPGSRRRWRGCSPRRPRWNAEEDWLFGPARRGDELPEGLRDRRSRLARLVERKARLEREEAERERAYSEHLARRAALEAERGRPLRGRKPVSKRFRSPATAQANTTDPDSRVVKRGPTLIQGLEAHLLGPGPLEVGGVEGGHHVRGGGSRRGSRPSRPRSRARSRGFGLLA